MSERNALKSRLAAEVATVVFGDDEVPSGAWGRLDSLVEDRFAEAPTGRLRSLVDDVGELRACDGCIETSGSVDFKGCPDDDWSDLQDVIKDAIDALEPRRQAEHADEPSGARSFEMVIHGRR